MTSTPTIRSDRLDPSAAGSSARHLPIPNRQKALTSTLTILQPQRGLSSLDLRSIWRHRELLYFLVWRSVKVRYKQAAIGVGWVVLQPIITMAILTVVFGRLANIPSDGIPYPAFVLAGLLPWTLFAQAMGRGTASVVSDANLITKVYFPRLLIPLAAITVPLVDFLVSGALLLTLLGWYNIMPTWRIVALPAFVALALGSALSVSLWLAPLNVRYRDIGQTIPFLVQAWMYASPIVYPVSMVPETWRPLYALNPMTGVIDGFRWALFAQPISSPHMLAVNVLLVSVALLAGLFYFRRSERTFADVV